MKLLVQLFFMFFFVQIYSQVGIGTTSPQEALHVSGDNSQLRVDGLGSENPLNKGEETPLAVDADGKFILSSAPTMEFVAMGKVQADVSVVKIYGAKVTKLNTGDYEVIFLTPQSDNNYIISLTVDSQSGSSASVARYYDQTKSSFKVNTTASRVYRSYSWPSGWLTEFENYDFDNSFMFTVYKIN